MDLGGPITTASDRVDLESIVALGASLKALVDALKNAAPRRLEGGRVIVLALVLSVLLGAVVAFAAFDAVRGWVYASVLMFLSALGIDVTGRWRAGKLPSKEGQS